MAADRHPYAHRVPPRLFGAPRPPPGSAPYQSALDTRVGAMRPACPRPVDLPELAVFHRSASSRSEIRPEMASMTEHDPIVVVGMARTAIGGFQGALAPLTAAELGGAAI